MLDTPEWKFNITASFILRDNLPSTICIVCNGSGGTHIGSTILMEEPLFYKSCSNCGGSGQVLINPIPPKPDVPDELIFHLRTAYWECLPNSPKPGEWNPWGEVSPPYPQGTIVDVQFRNGIKLFAVPVGGMEANRWFNDPANLMPSDIVRYRLSFKD